MTKLNFKGYCGGSDKQPQTECPEFSTVRPPLYERSTRAARSPDNGVPYRRQRFVG